MSELSSLRSRPPRLNESDPPALRCKALRAGGGQAQLEYWNTGILE